MAQFTFFKFAHHHNNFVYFQGGEGASNEIKNAVEQAKQKMTDVADGKRVNEYLQQILDSKNNTQIFDAATVQAKATTELNTIFLEARGKLYRSNNQASGSLQESLSALDKAKEDALNKLEQNKTELQHVINYYLFKASLELRVKSNGEALKPEKIDGSLKAVGGYQQTIAGLQEQLQTLRNEYSGQPDANKLADRVEAQIQVIQDQIAIIEKTVDSRVDATAAKLEKIKSKLDRPFSYDASQLLVNNNNDNNMDNVGFGLPTLEDLKALESGVSELKLISELNLKTARPSEEIAKLIEDGTQAYNEGMNRFKMTLSPQLKQQVRDLEQMKQRISAQREDYENNQNNPNIPLTQRDQLRVNLVNLQKQADQLQRDVDAGFAKVEANYNTVRGMSKYQSPEQRLAS